MEMDNTCRLCLNENSDSLEKLWEGCDVLDKLSFSLSHHISLTEDLPRKICCACTKTVYEIHSFHQQISENEIILQKRLKKYREDSLESIKEDNDSNGYDQITEMETFTDVDTTFKTEIGTDDNFVTDHLTLKDKDIIKVTVKSEFDEGNNIVSKEVNEKENSNNSKHVINNSEAESEKGKMFNMHRTKNTNINYKCVKNVQVNISGNKNTQNTQNIEVKDPCDDIPLSILKEKKIKDINIKNLTNKFTCLTCFEVFSNQLELLKHYRYIELEKFNKSNGFSNTDIKPVKYEILTDIDGSVMYKCDRCYKKYKLKKYIDRHIKSHTERRPFLCKLCGKTYQTATIIVAHGKMHSGQMYVCSYACGYQSVHKSNVADHEKRHRKEYKYKCETCGKGFLVRTSFQQHQNIHNDVKPYRCDQCGKAFHLHKYLVRHNSSAHPQSSKRKPWVCKHCSMPCDSKPSLNLHLKQAHGIITVIPFLCDICGKVFRNKRQMTHHKRAVHLKIRPHACSFCDKSFQKKYTLKIHEQTHTGKQHHCGQCGRLFTRKDTLARHLNNCHTDSRNKCRRCDKIFPTKLKLATHQKTCTSSSIILEDSLT